MDIYVYRYLELEDRMKNNAIASHHVKISPFFKPEYFVFEVRFLALFYICIIILIPCHRWKPTVGLVSLTSREAKLTMGF